MAVIMRQTVAGKNRICNGTCHKAEHQNCSCVCNGKYHGCSTRRSGNTQPKTVEEAEALIAKAEAQQTSIPQFTNEAPTLATNYPLPELVGRRVRSLREFSGVAVGRMGTVDEHYVTSQRHEGVMVAWDPKPEDNEYAQRHPTRDGFGRDAKFDETQWLELVY